MNRAASDRRAFFDALFNARIARDAVFDPWRQGNGDDAGGNDAPARRARLERHMDVTDPALLLVGEAPGYQGCRISGVPFTSEALLLEGAIPRVGQPNARISARDMPWHEPSATIVWGALYANRVAERTLLWNAFPWHPFNPRDGRLSNRTPTSTELSVGLPILEALLASLPPSTKIAAVGRKAQGLLAQAGCANAACLRHPAFGGATEFRNGLHALVTGN